MNPPELALLFGSILSSTLGQLLLKLGANKLGRVSSGNLISHVLSIATTPELVGGLACYGLGAIAYILLLTRVNLSIVGPSVALIYVFSVLIGYFVFQETIPLSRSLGLGLIVAGVILVLWQRSS